MTRLELDADRAVFDGSLEGMVLACYTDERPLRGLAGLFDWRFLGAISRCLRAGAITGQAGECVYLPVTRGGRVFHLFLAGAGALAAQDAPAGRRGPLPEETVAALRKNLTGLRVGGAGARIGASLTDLGTSFAKGLEKKLQGVPLWIVQ